MGLFFTLWSLALAAHALAPPRGGVARLHDLLTQRAVQNQAAHFARAARSVDSNWLTKFRGHEHLRLGSFGEARYHGLDGLTAPSHELLRAMLRAPCVTVQCSTPGLRREAKPRADTPDAAAPTKAISGDYLSSMKSAAPATKAAKSLPADYLSSIASAAVSNASAVAPAKALPADYLSSMSSSAVAPEESTTPAKSFPADYLSSMASTAAPPVAPAKALPADYLSSMSSSAAAPKDATKGAAGAKKKADGAAGRPQGLKNPYLTEGVGGKTWEETVRPAEILTALLETRATIADEWDVDLELLESEDAAVRRRHAWSRGAGTDAGVAAAAARADAKALPTFDLAAASARSEARRNARLEALYDECSVDPSASPECTQFECDDDDALDDACDISYESTPLRRRSYDLLKCLLTQEATAELLVELKLEAALPADGDASADDADANAVSRPSASTRVATAKWAERTLAPRIAELAGGEGADVGAADALMLELIHQAPVAISCGENGVALVDPHGVAERLMSRRRDLAERWRATLATVREEHAALLRAGLEDSARAGDIAESEAVAREKDAERRANVLPTGAALGEAAAAIAAAAAAAERGLEDDRALLERMFSTPGPAGPAPGENDGGEWNIQGGETDTWNPFE